MTPIKQARERRETERDTYAINIHRSRVGFRVSMRLRVSTIKGKVHIASLLQYMKPRKKREREIHIARERE